VSFHSKELKEQTSGRSSALGLALFLKLSLKPVTKGNPRDSGAGSWLCDMKGNSTADFLSFSSLLSGLNISGIYRKKKLLNTS